MGWFKNLFQTAYAPTRVFQVEPFTIIVADPRYIQEMWELKSNGNYQDVGGFFDVDARTVYVDADKWHPDRPELSMLGHEVWHLPELGGMWHKGKVGTNDSRGVGR